MWFNIFQNILSIYDEKKYVVQLEKIEDDFGNFETRKGLIFCLL